MGLRGPQRNPNSRRAKAEIRKRQQLTSLGKSAGSGPGVAAVSSADADQKLPTCPKWLPKPVAERWINLVIDMAAAGIIVQALDSRSIALAAGYESDLAALEAMEIEDAAEQMQAIRLKNSCRKDLLAALMAIGGTPVVRLRARIAPEEKPKAHEDEWSEL